MHRLTTLVVAVALLLVGCTTSSPDPSPSPSPTATTTAPTPSATTPPPGRVAVVVAPEPELTAAAAEIGTRGVAGRMLDDGELRVVTADDRSFLPDMASFLAAEGYDLVCVVGAGAEAAVRDVAASSPSTRFCAAPARPDDMPANVLPIDLRVEELGYLAGIALAADGAGPETAVVASPTTWAPARVRAGFEAGLAAGGVASPTVRPVGPVRDAEGAAEQVVGLLEIGVSAVLSLTGRFDATVRSTLVDTPVTPPAPPTETASPTETETSTEG